MTHADDLNKMGDQLFKQRNYKESMDYYHQSVEAARAENDEQKAGKFEKELEEATALYAKTINDAGDKFYKNKQFKEAIEQYANALNVLKSAGEKWVNKFGREFINELSKAKVGIAGQLQDEAEKAIKAKNWEEAIRKYTEAVQVIPPDVNERLNKDLNKTMWNVYERWAQDVNNQGDSFYKNKKYEEAISAYAQSVNLAEKSGNEGMLKNFKKEMAKAFSEQAAVVNNKGDKLMKEGKYNEAATLYIESVKIAEEAGNKKLVENFTKERDTAFAKFAQEINNKGDKAYKEGNYELATKIYRNSVEIAQEAKDKRMQENFSKELNKTIEKWGDQVDKSGDSSMKNRNWQDAVEKYKKAVEIVTQGNNKSQIQNYQNELAKSHLEWAKAINSEGDNLFKAGKYQEAYQKYARSVELAALSGDKGAYKNFQKEMEKALKKMQG